MITEAGQGQAAVKFAELLLKKGMPEEAVRYLKDALQKDPGCADAHYTLAAIKAGIGKFTIAEEHFRKALRLAPESHKAHNGLGVVLQQQGLLEEALIHYREAAGLHPWYQDAQVNLAMLLKSLGRPGEAGERLKEAIKVQPDVARLWYNLANILMASGQSEEAVHAYRETLRLEPEHLDAHQNLLFALHYSPCFSPRQIFEEHLSFAARHAEPLRPRMDRAPLAREERRIRLGYLSPDFREHSVAYFIEPILRHHDRSRFEIFCYANVASPCRVTERLQGLCDRWINICGVGDEAAARQIASHGIDILVDLAGHTGGSRPLLLARKPAPIQVTWIGYPNTSALPTVDYRLTDTLVDPPGESDELHTEALIRLPRIFSCYGAPNPSPPVAPPPFRRNGYLTFGSFNNLAKVTPEVLGLWAQVLLALPTSRLLVKAKALSGRCVAARIRETLGWLGVDPERIDLEGGNVGTYEHLEQYGRVDMALDTFPYNGTTTTCEALWMGVPVLTLAGKSHAGRTGVTILTNCGLSELIAEHKAEYVATAVRLAGDPDHLAELRQGLRKRVQRSPVMDAAGVTAEVERVFTDFFRAGAPDAVARELAELYRATA
ncbi:tetratricopeptide repeat protein [Geomonas sp. RF6]|uniref:O-linked N-acetylglucosamine transferase, SPINDLY family protein n=1 Tax=Geomonas sp. RF6 TaxID=2897342 RepID=UPI001E3A246B|nr:tetratricopeptide repeat protein [Geomonas sp. RF6]UFS72424.1 tetratricopeptide repeat protein [Geomonas sp. RF6]